MTVRLQCCPCQRPAVISAVLGMHLPPFVPARHRVYDQTDACPLSPPLLGAHHAETGCFQKETVQPLVQEETRHTFARMNAVAVIVFVGWLWTRPEAGCEHVPEFAPTESPSPWVSRSGTYAPF